MKKYIHAKQENVRIHIRHSVQKCSRPGCVFKLLTSTVCAFADKQYEVTCSVCVNIVLNKSHMFFYIPI